MRLVSTARVYDVHARWSSRGCRPGSVRAFPRGSSGGSRAPQGEGGVVLARAEADGMMPPMRPITLLTLFAYAYLLCQLFYVAWVRAGWARPWWLTALAP